MRRTLTGALAALMASVCFVTFSNPRLPAAAQTSCPAPTKLAAWSNVQLVNELVVVPLSAYAVSSNQSVAREGYGGIILTSATGPTDLATQLATLRSLVPRHAGLLVMGDEEGGGVWRLANLVAPLPWAKQQALLGPSSILNSATRAAKSFSALGINMDLAPVLDLDGSNVVPGPSNADGLRSYSANPQVASNDGVAFMKGLIAGGVIPVIKHFPGLGGVSPNTDYGAATTKPWSVVQQSALVPFKNAIAAGAPAIMVSSATIPGLTSLPASVSPAVVTGVIRQQLHFNGLVLTDSLTAGAFFDAHLPLTVAAVMAIRSGVNLLLFTAPKTMMPIGVANRVSQALLNAVSSGQLTRQQLITAAAPVLQAKGYAVC